MRVLHELEYLKGLSKQYGSWYFKQYFGFTLKDIAQKVGISKITLSLALTGKRDLPIKYEEAFKRVFAELKIEERTKDFKMSQSQQTIRSLRERTKNS